MSADKKPGWKDIVIQKRKEGKIVLRDVNGLWETNVSDFIQQSADGILYDLNRDEATVLSMDDPKWMNDFAVGVTIRALHAEVARLQEEVRMWKQTALSRETVITKQALENLKLTNALKGR
jgi:hypothetical protein